MPTKGEHLKQAKHNERFVADYSLIRTNYNDWAVVAIFHAALHYVEAYFFKHWNLHHTNHGDRDNAIYKCLGRIYDDYFDLKNDARGARYDMKRFPLQEIEEEIIPLLDNIKQYIISQLKK